MPNPISLTFSYFALYIYKFKRVCYFQDGNLKIFCMHMKGICLRIITIPTNCTLGRCLITYYSRQHVPLTVATILRMSLDKSAIIRG
jgi:hypothetical protein